MMAWITNRFTDSAAPQARDLQYWREQILKVVLVMAALIGGIAYAINAYLAAQKGDIGLVVVYTVFYLWLLVITIFRRISYNIRAGSILLLLYATGFVSGLTFASAGDLRVWLLGFSILTGAFLGLREGITAAIISTATQLIMGILMNQHVIPAPHLAAIDPTNLESWTTTSIPFFAVSVLGVISFGVLINGLRASLLEANQLAAEIGKDRTALQERTSVLERREAQIQTAANISRAISAQLETQTIFQHVVDLVKEEFGLYYVGVFTLDQTRHFAVLRAGTGQAGQNMLAASHKLAMGGTSMIGQSVSRREARIALDVGTEAVFFRNPHLPDTRSELALPIVIEDRVLGAMTVQSAEPEAFDQDDITVLQGIADSLAIAINQAQLFDQTQASLKEISTLHRQYLSKAWADTIAQEGELSQAFEKPDPGVGEPLGAFDIPLMLHDQVIGTITVENDQIVSPEDVSFMEDIATQAALGLENARLVKQTERDALHNRTVTDITAKIWASTNIDTILRTSLQELGQALQVSNALITLSVPEKEDDK